MTHVETQNDASMTVSPFQPYYDDIRVVTERVEHGGMTPIDIYQAYAVIFQRLRDAISVNSDYLLRREMEKWQ